MSQSIVTKEYTAGYELTKHLRESTVLDRIACYKKYAKCSTGKRKKAVQAILCGLVDGLNDRSGKQV